jgi:hypothetical protein
LFNDAVIAQANVVELEYMWNGTAVALFKVTSQHLSRTVEKLQPE